jgi:hypothetical protein
MSPPLVFPLCPPLPNKQPAEISSDAFLGRSTDVKITEQNRTEQNAVEVIVAHHLNVLEGSADACQ